MCINQYTMAQKYDGPLHFFFVYFFILFSLLNQNSAISSHHPFVIYQQEMEIKGHRVQYELMLAGSQQR